MPLHRSTASGSIPAVETIESLLSQPDESRRARRQIKTLQELTEREKQRTGLVKLGTRCTIIPGDPFGRLMSWAGNVAHPKDDRIFDIMEPILDELLAASMENTDNIKRIQALLELIPYEPFERIRDALSVKETYAVIRDDPQEIVVTFKLFPTLSVRLRKYSVHCKDVNKNDEASYRKASRAKQAQARTMALVDDPPMTRELTQFIMASLITKDKSFEINEDEDIAETGPSNDTYTDSSSRGSLYELRKAAQEHYWYGMSQEERAVAREECSRLPRGFEFRSNLEKIQQGWQKAWNTAAWHPDYFRIYYMDQLAAKNIWELVEEDIFVAIDVNRQVIFANVENLYQTLWGSHLAEVLIRCFDMWAYFTPLPAPESCRHATDSHVRKIHPELDMSKATVATLPDARMCVAHYGCWESRIDPQGRRIFKTSDTRFGRDDCTEYSERLFPRFSRAALGKATEMIRFLVRPLDRDFYEESLQMLSSLDSEEKITTSEEDFLSLFALGVNGYTARHMDKKDIEGGLAGLCTFGRYTGKQKESLKNK
ncbi:hypothetical protein HD806DRAFT_545754 [Xylariaceae sp. AK1471]|nr:hypothetical protein HD806DRAFT_545754 [Xylariaceae sp. AK1471]